LLLQVPTILLGILIIALALALAVAVVVLVNRHVPIELRKSHATGLGQIMGSLAAIFGIMVGFSSYIVLSEYHGAQLAVENEADNVYQIYALAQLLPQPKQEEIQGLATSYARVVAEEEWPVMREGRISLHAQAIAVELRRSIQDGYKTSRGAQLLFYGELLDVMDQLQVNRQVRNFDVRLGLPLILWVALVVLGTIIVGFSLLVNMENHRLHLLAVCALAAGIAGVLFTIFVLDYPYGTDISGVSSEPFEILLQFVEGQDTR
jgi:hypothetical protein